MGTLQLQQLVQLIHQPAEVIQGRVDRSGCSMSTPASRSRSSGFRAAPFQEAQIVVDRAVAAAGRRSTRSDRAIAADKPVAYL